MAHFKLDWKWPSATVMTSLKCVMTNATGLRPVAPFKELNNYK